MDTSHFEFMNSTKVKLEPSSDDENMVEKNMKVKAEYCSDEEDKKMMDRMEEIVKEDHIIDEDDDSKRLVKNRQLSIFMQSDVYMRNWNSYSSSQIISFL